MSTIEHTSQPDTPAPPIFDVDLWRDRIQEAIRRQMPGVTFGTVAKIPLDDDGRDRGWSTIEDYCGKNGYFFIFEVSPDVLSVQADPDEMDDILDSHLTATVYYLLRCGVAYPYDKLICEIKHLECIRLMVRFADAVRGIIYVDVAK